MYSNPSDTPLLTNPVGIDAPIQNLQIQLKNKLPWLQKSFGRAYVGRQKRSKSSDYIFPALYNGDGEDVYDGSPNDNLISYSFFEIGGQYDAIDPESYGQGGTNNYLAPVSLIVWGNLNKINEILATPYSTQNFSQNLLQDILVVLRQNYDFKVVSVLDNLYNIFEGYTARTDDPRFYYYPYFAFKVKMEVAFTEECQVTNVIT
jgi:hypothetical protein